MPRTKKWDFDPAVVDDNGIADDLPTGTSWSLSGDAEWLADNSGDNLAHQLVITTAGNEPAGNSPVLTLTGTDADGFVQTEAITLPNATTIETTKYFLTVVSAVASAATIDTFDIGWVDEFASHTIPVDSYKETPPSVGLNVTGTISLDVQLTTDNPFRKGEGEPLAAAIRITDQESMLWIDDANLAAETADVHGAISPWPVNAIRLIANSYSSGAEVQMALTHAH
jgi:hypothetical protein